MKRPVLVLMIAVTGCAAPTAAAVPSEIPSSTPAPATATMTSTTLPPSVTATFAPAPRTFTDDFVTNLPYWILVQPSTGQGVSAPSIVNDYLTFHLQSPNQWAYQIYAPHSYADVRVDARLEFDAAGEGAAGVVCRYDAEAGWYEFNIYADQTYALMFGQWLAEGIARYIPLVVSQSEDITSSANEIGLACQGDILTPFVNGVQLRQRQEALHVLKKGAIGLTAASFEQAPLVILYDWITVTNP